MFEMSLPRVRGQATNQAFVQNYINFWDGVVYTYVCTRCVLRPTVQHFLSSRHIRRSCIGSEVALASIDAPPSSTVVVVVCVVGGGCRCVDRHLLMKMMTSLLMNHYRCLPLNRVEK